MYFVLVIVLLVLVGLFVCVRLLCIEDEVVLVYVLVISIVCIYLYLVWGVVGIFFYVGVEVSIGSLLINFI